MHLTYFIDPLVSERSKSFEVTQLNYYFVILNDGPVK